MLAAGLGCGLGVGIESDVAGVVSGGDKWRPSSSIHVGSGVFDAVSSGSQSDVVPSARAMRALATLSDSLSTPASRNTPGCGKCMLSPGVCVRVCRQTVSPAAPLGPLSFDIAASELPRFSSRLILGSALSSEESELSELLRLAFTVSAIAVRTPARGSGTTVCLVAAGAAKGLRGPNTPFLLSTTTPAEHKMPAPQRTMATSTPIPAAAVGKVAVGSAAGLAAGWVEVGSAAARAAGSVAG
ncbi:hypothetical protein T492DRAFT_898568 [Pavlovales sp. CCMP2436]|nr:hypothetical protein T492DRAFT_898568 [Pavlovales sp. CCMP2436]